MTRSSVQLLLAATLTLVATAAARADVERECPDPKNYVMTQNRGCVKRVTLNDRYRLALDALAKDPKKAMSLFDAACTAKHGPSCTQLAFLYNTGRARVVGSKTEVVIAKDHDKAVKLWEKGCDLGDGAGCQKRGNDLMSTDWKIARKWLERGCAKRDGIACAQLGWILEKSDPPDPKAARAVYDQAQKILGALCPGDGQACVVRGYLYERGVGVPVDAKKARDAYEKACAAGSGDGCYSLALNLAEDAKSNPAAIVDAYKKACKYDRADACSHIAVQLAAADKTKTSLEPLELAKHGCELEPKHCYAYAEMYRVGAGVKPDPGMASAMYLETCRGGDQGACVVYAKRARTGEGMAADNATALRLLDAACTAKEKEGCENLAQYLSLDATDDARAFTAATAGCDLGSAHAYYIAAWMIRHNRRGTAKLADADAGKQALPLFDKGCESQSAPACYEAGLIYEKAVGTAADRDKAIARYRTGCDAKTPDKDACWQLAVVASSGASKDLKLALHAAARACTLGADICEVVANVVSEPDHVAIAVGELAPACQNGVKPACFAEATVELRGSTADKRKGFELLSTTCQQKYAPACVALATAVYQGSAGPADHAKGEQLYAQSCDDGMAEACYQLAAVLHRDKDKTDYSTAVRYADRACTLKHADACSVAGYIYYVAMKGVGWDINKAADYWTKGCALGSAIACANTGELYRYGIIAAADPKKSFEFYTKSCDAGNPYGCAGVAHFLATGEGGATKDAKRAIELFRVACDAESSEGCAELAVTLEAEHGSASEIARIRLRAYNVTEKLAETNPAYMYRLGTFYRDGVATMKDPAKARQWFVKACERYDPLGCIAAGRTLAKSPLATDREQARVFFERACGAGIDDGCKGQQEMKAAGGAPAASTTPMPGTVKAKGCGGCSGAGSSAGGLAIVLACAFARRRRRA